MHREAEEFLSVRGGPQLGKESCELSHSKCRSRQPHLAKKIPVQGEHFSRAPDSNCRPNFSYNGLVFYKGYQGKAGVQGDLKYYFPFNQQWTEIIAIATLWHRLLRNFH